MRRRRLLWLVLICCIAVVLALGLSENHGPASSPISTNGQVSVDSVRLSVSADYTGMSVVGGRLMLIDYGDSVPHAANGGTCRTAIVNAESLRMSEVTRGPCDDPALFHRNVMAVDQNNDSSQISVRIATVDSRARSGYILGPVLVSYNQCSDCWDTSIAGPRSLWEYAPFATRQTTTAVKGELLRVSERTGKVLQRWQMPSMPRPVLAVDSDGLWITTSIDGAGPSVVYNIRPGSRQPDPVVRFATKADAGLPARFLVAEDHTVWFETYPGTLRTVPRLWQLDSTHAVIRGQPAPGVKDCADSGEGQATVLGNATIGFYCVTEDWPNDQITTKQNVFQILPGALSQHRVATVAGPPETYDLQAAAVLGRSYYFLDPPTQTQAQANDFYGSTKTSDRTTMHTGILFRITSH